MGNVMTRRGFRWMLAVAISCSPYLVGCGGDDSTTLPTGDGGSDATTDAPQTTDGSSGDAVPGGDAAGDTSTVHDADAAVDASGGVPSAVRHVTAYAGPGVVYVRFQSPASSGLTPITSYTAIASTGQSHTEAAVIIDPGLGTSYHQANCRVDIPGMPAGISVTVVVTATNAGGTGPASAPSNSVTPTSVPNPYFAVVGNQNPAWGDFSYGSGAAIYGVTPGPAPTNPVNPANNVVELTNGEGFQPYFKRVDPSSTQGGRFKLAPYANLILRVWPTGGTPGEQIGFLKTVWVDGVATASSSTLLTDTTQNWPTNIFAGAVVANITTGAIVSYNVTSNTATTITLGSGGAINPGDYYEIAVPDIAIGRRINIGNGSNPPGVTGPTTMTLGAWNTYSIPLSVFNASSGSYATVTGADILKLGMQPSSGTSSTRYVCEVGFD